MNEQKGTVHSKVFMKSGLNDLISAEIIPKSLPILVSPVLHARLRHIVRAGLRK